eukprot:CAMPEP_0203815338 /NCGR_PEP_ID=MMETSP0115-20131106/10252_1 /ASSEMBLY_ACC=CAM_ASM_000227 /TAXON_ID=33651 /ORGANISM="Bicosoecid sp, Strain ms1" /LENGTH=918 /DNA_ID=CAMNT_0050724235 /DNA_START=180 /DNA_END=2933 /DNA_ORIENTATION=+
MQPIYFHRPENALRRANELVDVGQETDAIKLLYSVFTSRKFKVWQKAHEPVMKRFFELCVNQKDYQMAKEGLYNYRSSTHKENPHSFQSVIRHLVYIAEKRADDARRATRGSSAALRDVQDLEEGDTPEELMMSSVSSAERLNREQVVPWVRFLWEVYRAVLDTLRHNTPTMDATYHRIAARAFAFCEEYKRPVEMRRLCNLMRGHMNNYTRVLAQYEAGTWTDRGRDVFAPWSPDIMDRHLNTRFLQLQTATNMKLWTEGFRTVEDIYFIMEGTKRPPRAQSMALYFERLTQIFWVSKNFLFHAYARFKFYTLSVAQNRALSAADKARLASNVLLSALCVQLEDANATDGALDMDLETDKKMRIAALLRFSVAPSRAQLMSDIAAKGVVDAAEPGARELFRMLEKDFEPLGMARRAEALLRPLARSTEQQMYVPELEHLVLLRLVQQLSAVYRTVRISSFARMLQGLYLGERVVQTPYGEGFLVEIRADGRVEWRMPFGTMITERDAFPVPLYGTLASRAEEMIVRAAKKRLVQVRIDHLSDCLHLGQDGLEDPRMSKQLSVLAARLRDVVAVIKPVTSEVRAARRQAVFTAARSSLGELHGNIQSRKATIEKRKEDLEREQQQKQRDEAERKAKAAEERRVQEEQRRKDEAQRRAQAQQRKAEERLKLEETRKLMQRTGQDTSALDGMERVGGLGADAAAMRQEAERKAEKAKLNEVKRMRDTARRRDHLTRALREAEWSLLKKQRDSEIEGDKEFFDSEMQAVREKHRAEHQAELAIRKRLERMIPFLDRFEEGVRDRGREKAEVRRQEAEAARMVRYKKRLHAAREAQLEEERQEREAEDLERRMAEEDERRAAEEEREVAAAEAAKREEERRIADEEAREKEFRDRRDLHLSEDARKAPGGRGDDRDDRDDRD